MTDIARIGFQADTDDLALAEVRLKKLAVQSAETEIAAKSLEKTKTSAALKIAKAADLEASSALKLARADSSSNTALIDGLVAAQKKTQATLASAQAADLNASAALDSANAMLTEAQAALKLAGALGAANDNIIPANKNLRAIGQTAGQQQANLSNLAAQFQDIGVTAAMGMNPLLIGLQQGTQIALVMSNVVGQAGLGGAVKALASSFLNLVSVASLFSIGLTVLLASLAQMVNWTKVLKAALNELADVLQVATPYLVAFGGAMLLYFAPSIVVGIVNGIAAISGGILSMAAAIYATVGLPVLLIAGLLALVAAAIAFRDDLKKILGFDIVKAMEDGLNYIIAYYVAAYKTIVVTWKEFPAVLGDIVMQAANGVVAGVEWMINASIEGLNKLPGVDIGKVMLGRFKNEFAGAASNVGGVFVDEFNKAVSQKLGTKAIAGVVDFGKNLADRLRKLAAGLGDDGKPKKPKRDPWADMQRDVGIRIEGLKAEGAAIGLVGEASFRAAAFQDLLSKAKHADIPITAAVIKQINAWADSIAHLQAVNASNKYYNDNLVALQKDGAAIQTQIDLIGMSTVAAAAYTEQRKILNDQLTTGITLTVAQQKGLIDQAVANAKLNETLKEQTEIYNVQKDAATGLFKDLYTSLQQGKSIWDSFANAVGNALSKISDKLMDLWLSDAFNAIAGNGGPTGQGDKFLNTVLGNAGKALSGIGDFLGLAKGGVLQPSGVKKFANGSVFNSPTLFGYGQGKTGMLGEAGPEAVMPLKRAPDGSLGVQTTNNGGNTVTLIVRAEEGEMFRPTVEAIADDRAVNVVTVGISDYNDQLPDRVIAISKDQRLR